jgi:phage shock protein A
MFGFFKRKKAPPAPVDPLATFDRLIEDLERQSAEVRKSAATLLALKGELSRSVTRYTARLADIAHRRQTADDRGDAKGVGVMERDRVQTERLLESTRESLRRAEQDAGLLLEAAGDLGGRVADLRIERESASARIAAGGIVTEALREQVERFDRVMALEAARDEVEKAHALADIYRDEHQPQAPPERVK